MIMQTPQQTHINNLAAKKIGSYRYTMVVGLIDSLFLIR